jgi:hypothetical protein
VLRNWWANTAGREGHVCDRFGCIVLEFAFQPDALVYTRAFDNINSDLRRIFCSVAVVSEGGGGGRVCVRDKMFLW